MQTLRGSGLVKIKMLASKALKKSNDFSVVKRIGHFEIRANC